MVTVDCSPEGSGTILPSTNTDTRRPDAGSPGLICSTLCSVARSPVELELSGAGCALNKVQATVPRSTWDIDGIGFHDAALFSGSALGLLAHHTRDLT